MRRPPSSLWISPLLKITSLLVGASCAVTGTAASGTSALENALNTQLAMITGRIWAEQDAKTFVSKTYLDDAVSSTGNSPLASGTSELLAGVKEYMAEFKSVRVHTLKVRPLGSTSASQFVEYDVMPREAGSPTLHLKCLNVWSKKRGGWRIADEMCIKMEPDSPNASSTRADVSTASPLTAEVHR